MLGLAWQMLVSSLQKAGILDTAMIGPGDRKISLSLCKLGDKLKCRPRHGLFVLKRALLDIKILNHTPEQLCIG